MTAIGDILQEFFSPISSETLWLMPETDDYTVRVRKWDPVIQSVGRTKFNLSSDCAKWSRDYVSSSTWKPTMTDSPKPGAFRDFVASPPGTDPETCKSAFIIYVKSMAANKLPFVGPLIPVEQTDNLYTCSIGSFNIYTTVDSIDCGAKTATMNFWMYNAMSVTSFGQFASHPVFKLCGMKTQFMWWNWVEDVNWSTGIVKTLPRSAVASGW